MPSGRLSPSELVTELRALAEIAALECFPVIGVVETIEGDAAQFVETAARFLADIASGSGPLAERAASILGRME